MYTADIIALQRLITMQVPESPKLSARSIWSASASCFPALNACAADFLRREISSRMFDRLEWIKIAPSAFWMPVAAPAPICRVAKMYPAAQILGLMPQAHAARASRAPNRR
jgi:malonyl-CoA O-methyltransferase